MEIWVILVVFTINLHRKMDSYNIDKLKSNRNNSENSPYNQYLAIFFRKDHFRAFTGASMPHQ